MKYNLGQLVKIKRSEDCKYEGKIGVIIEQYRYNGYLIVNPVDCSGLRPAFFTESELEPYK